MEVILRSQTHDSIVVVDKFIQATRDSGYKGTVSALSELVDNSLQAGATRVDILIDDYNKGHEHPLEVAIIDNGCGMTGKVLQQSLRFGGSSRFNDRTGMGRYGMGLPNASLSQAKIVEVYSWVNNQSPNYSYLDVDEIIDGTMKVVPGVKKRRLPQWARDCADESGTMVYWRNCDRLENKRLSTLIRRVEHSIGRIFRHYIWKGILINVNDNPVVSVDPLFFHSKSINSGAFEISRKISF